MTEVVPAILVKTKREFIKKISLVAPYVERVQWDIMDGIFVPNKTWGQPDDLARAWKKLGLKIRFEVHLMVKDNKKWLRPLIKENAERIFFHFEAVKNPKAIFDLIGRYNRKFGAKTPKHPRFHRGATGQAKIGLAINPETEFNSVKQYFKFLDTILVMGVNPGFSGQNFQEVVLNKIKQIKKSNPRIEIGVDGGVSLENAKSIIAAGADYLVAASAIFGSKNIKEAIKQFKNI